MATPLIHAFDTNADYFPKIPGGHGLNSENENVFEAHGGEKIVTILQQLRFQ